MDYFALWVYGFHAVKLSIMLQFLVAMSILYFVKITIITPCFRSFFVPYA